MRCQPAQGCTNTACGGHSLAILALPSKSHAEPAFQARPCQPHSAGETPAGLARTSFGAWISMAPDAQLCKARLRHPQLAVFALPPSRSDRLLSQGPLASQPVDFSLMLKKCISLTIFTEWPSCRASCSEQALAPSSSNVPKSAGSSRT